MTMIIQAAWGIIIATINVINDNPAHVGINVNASTMSYG